MASKCKAIMLREYEKYEELCIILNSVGLITFKKHHGRVLLRGQHKNGVAFKTDFTI
jgi:hypothetical protein